MELFSTQLHLLWKVTIDFVETVANDPNLAKINKKFYNEKDAMVGTETESNVSWFIWPLKPWKTIPKIYYQSHGFGFFEYLSFLFQIPQVFFSLWFEIAPFFVKNQHIKLRQIILCFKANY